MADGVSERLRCFICGRSTADAVDYVLVKLTSDYNDAEQFFGSHAACLNGVVASGFHVEVQMM